MLVVMMGLAGTGKSAVAEGVARSVHAPVFSVDPLEAALLRSGITREQRSDYIAYDLAAALARSQLALGQPAIIDAVNPIELVRGWWRDIAIEFDLPRAVIECVCSDVELHRRRIEARARDISGFIYEPSWEDVQASRAGYEPCTEDRLVLDAVAGLAANISRAIEYVSRFR